MQADISSAERKMKIVNKSFENIHIFRKKHYEIIITLMKKLSRLNLRNAFYNSGLDLSSLRL
jgi:hypothetical protein